MDIRKDAACSVKDGLDLSQEFNSTEDSILKPLPALHATSYLYIFDQFVWFSTC